MDSGTIALIASPLSIIITALLTQFVVRRNARENTEIGRFEANLAAYEGRAKSAEEKVTALAKEVADSETRIRALEEKDAARERQLTRIRTVVQDWFRDLKNQWEALLPNTPMPMPADEDLELIGITRPRARRK